jgi:hypothetical protein
MVAFTAGSVLTAQNLNSAFNALTFRAVTGTSDTFVLADNGGAVSYSNASPITATVPPFSSVAYANGTVIQLLNLGAGVVTVTAGVGVTLNGSSVALAQNTGGTLIKTATNTWYFLPSSTGSGMDLITPTSVAGSGVTLSGGQVTFTAATAVSVNGCFSATYQNYVLMWRGTSSANTINKWRMRLAGTDATAATYQTQLLQAASATVGAALYSSETSGFFGYTETQSVTVAQFFSPAEAANTLVDIANFSTIAIVTKNSIGSSHQTATAYDGITIFPTTGNVTGTLRIYGLRNS